MCKSKMGKTYVASLPGKHPVKRVPEREGYMKTLNLRRYLPFSVFRGVSEEQL